MTSFNIDSRLIGRFSLVIISLSLILPDGAKAMKSNYQVLNIGAIIGVNSRIGKEQKTAMTIAVQKFNNHSKSHRLSLYFKDPPRGPLQAADAAEELIKKRGVKVIIGMDRWEEAAAVAEIGSQVQVPVLSFSAPAITPPLTLTRWPFLVRMANNDPEQMRCIAAILRSYNWKRVVPVYEDDMLGGDSGKVALLTGAIKDVGSEIEYGLVLPPFSTLADPKEAVQEELNKLLGIKSRVFIVLQTSLPMLIHLFREAKKMGLVETDTVWILGGRVSGFMDSVNTSVIYTMEGSLGIKNYYLDDTSSYHHFFFKFRQIFRSEYPEEDSFEPGFYALRAYDGITAIIQAVERIPLNKTNSPKVLLRRILSSNFTGLSGQIQFQDGQLSDDSTLRVVNVVGKKYKEIDFWLPGFGFSKRPKAENANITGDPMRLGGKVSWPGEPTLDPKGWAMPSRYRPMIIGVPGRTSFNAFVKVDVNEKNYEGFCIELFYKVKKLLGYPLYYKFVPYNGTYDDLVNHVYNKTYDAIVGDVTILADRSEKVEFTQPYLESGLSMIVPEKSEESAWMFTKPFTLWMWVTTGAILIYTTLVVWFLERQNNPEFKGSRGNQIGTAVMFTFSSLFFAHREKLHNNLTRFVLIVWLFVVLILSSSYTASLTSMLTIRQLQPNVTDIKWLIRNNLKVGCDEDSFVRTYLEEVLKFKPENVINISSQDKYPEEFQSGNIAAAFLELPYAKVFIDHYCKQYAAITPIYRFGGLGFVFQKGSPMATEVSKAILTLLENGEVISLEEEWFAPSRECSSNSTDNDTGSLSLRNFWGLYGISGTTSTICVLISLVFKYLKHKEESNKGNASPTSSNESVWAKTFRFAKFIYHGEQVVTTISASSPDADELISANFESSRPSDSSSDNRPSCSSPEIEVVSSPNGSST